MFKIFAVIVVIILIGLGFFINSQSADFSVSRNLLISAPADKLFNQVNDFRNWKNWSPWAKLDPNQRTEISINSVGKGAVMAWSGNNQVGQGKNTIVESQPAELVILELDFIKPFKSSSRVEFTFEGKGAQTRVSWTMHGKKNFIMKVMHFVMDCDKMLGAQFEEGLNNLAKITG